MTASPAAPTAPATDQSRPIRAALLGNPNTGKTTLFNRLSGLRHKTSNFPGTTQEARIGYIRSGNADFELIDLPGIYSLELQQTEAELCRNVLGGSLAPAGEFAGAPDAVIVVVDATNLARNLMLVGEVLRRRLPTLVVLNMIDLAEHRGLKLDPRRLTELLGCDVVACSARSGRGIDRLRDAIVHARVANQTPPGTDEGLAAWADDLYEKAVPPETSLAADTLTDRLDRAFTHPVLGVAIFALTMAALFYAIFKFAALPMDLIDNVFGGLQGRVKAALPPGVVGELLADGIVAGVGATVIFLPQICLLFFLISLLEDTGYLARAAFVMDRVLRPFGLPGHAFVPLLSSHACALPGIMAARAVPDRRERLATILVAPFMSCSARLPVYILVTTLLFRDRPAMAALAFVGCYALGIGAGVFSALIARRTILRGRSRPMAMELPSFKLPSLRTAFLTTYDRAVMFLKKAGTNILAICIILWWLSAYPHVEPPRHAGELRQQATELRAAAAALSTSDAAEAAGRAEALEADADRLEASHAAANSYAGRLGRFVQPVFAPLGYDWQLSVGVVTSFAAREVFASTMAVIVTGSDDAEDQGIMDQIGAARRDDGITPVFTVATCWSLLIYYVLAMQCLPTLAVTARESGHIKWALVQLGWMSGLAYGAALIVFQTLRASGIA